MFRIDTGRCSRLHSRDGNLRGSSTGTPPDQRSNRCTRHWRPHSRNYPGSCFAIGLHGQTGRHAHLLRNHSSPPAEADLRRIGSLRSIYQHDSSDTAEARRYTASSDGDTDPDVDDPNIAVDNATGLSVARARVTDDAASRVAVAAAVAVDTAPGAVAGTVRPVDGPAIADPVTPAGHCSTIDGLLADRVTPVGHCSTIDGRPAVGAAVLPLRPDSVAFARPSAVCAAAEGSGPAVVDSAVFGFSQPVAVVALAQTGAAAALGLAVPGFYQRVVVAAQTGAAAVEPAATVPAV